MILAFDTYYFNDKAKTVCLSFKDWFNEKPFEIYSETIPCIEEYVSGEFYRRELPNIISLMSKIDKAVIELIIVDGFVYLNDENKFGLGAYLHEKLNKQIPIIGVAKRTFATIEKNKVDVYRGKSKNPLFVTSIGIELKLAAKKIKEMEGEYRIPTLLKELDKLTREI
ncbi:endonuclease V [Subsaximicrobium wynnwilliamsii]|uniref:Endonuclease V n=1 Tax=Subsaximicrobium wynnwilliamsii TaxID=291179 RepID=A0A5C6ZBL6_9FLAO|nr:endonuclease V [Subsaximicrobium wynnwilliamsii]TXD80879.1 endonuclease V [Subsaximicrobium wynnwilliamsii]TXD86223.1 endonuclease V [Subsaximicrobium wynnwilliamsii]TXD99599.1 endonuclease V [Subsaximicrobium wynnwilliamsii]